MAADIEQDDLFLGCDNGQYDSIAVGKADGLNTFELAAEVVLFQACLARVLLQITEGIGEFLPLSVRWRTHGSTSTGTGTQSEFCARRRSASVLAPPAGLTATAWESVV